MRYQNPISIHITTSTVVTRYNNNWSRRSQSKRYLQNLWVGTIKTAFQSRRVQSDESEESIRYKKAVYMGQHVESVYDKILATVEPEDMLIDSSTIDSDMSQTLSKRAKEKSAIAFDAPVSGGTVGAANGFVVLAVVDIVGRIRVWGGLLRIRNAPLPANM